MKIQSNLNETQRINFLNENQEEITTLVTSLGGNLNDVINTLTQCLNDSNFYDFCSMETMCFDVEKRIEEIIEETSGTINNDTETQNFFEEQRRKQMNLLY